MVTSVNKNNIVLVGFMGTGKTAVARKLASKMSMRYVSVDEIVEKNEKRPISEIFRLEGEPYFRKLEKEIIKDLSAGSAQVIDCGGGAVVDQENLDNLRASGWVFCLWADPAEIFRRVGGSRGRPLLNVEDPMKKIEELLEKRKSCYMKADFHIDTTGKTPAVVAEEVRRTFDGAGMR